MWKVAWKSQGQRLRDHSDKVVLPERILDEVIGKYEDGKLPHPLTFKVSSVTSTCIVGVQEFGSEMEVPRDVQVKLGLTEGDVVQVELVEITNEEEAFIQIRPVTRVQGEGQWKSIMEAKLPQFYTVISTGDRIWLPVGNKEYVFDVVKVKGRNVCVVDQDIELRVDNVVESEDVEEFPVAFDWSEVSVESMYEGIRVDRGVKIRFKVREGDVVAGEGEFVIGDQADQFEWCSTSVSGGEKAWENETHERDVSLYALTPLMVRVRGKRQGVKEQQTPSDKYRCGVCEQFVNTSAKLMHDAFCARNSVECPRGCGKRYARSIPETHWHCCGKWGETLASLQIHEYYMHDKGHQGCQACGVALEGTLYAHAVHKYSECPQGAHVCRYCHLEVPRGVASYEARYHNVSQHEWLCGAKTGVCPLCGKSVRLREMVLHGEMHSRARDMQPEPQVCTNVLCVRMQGHNPLGLCDVCFGPLYSPARDPDGKMLSAKLERRYVLAMKNGCHWRGCPNELCRSSPQFTQGALSGMAEIVRCARAQLNAAAADAAADTPENAPAEAPRTPRSLRLCVDESAAVRMRIVDMLSKKYSFPWRCRAVAASATGAAAAAGLGGGSGAQAPRGPSTSAPPGSIALLNDWLERHAPREEGAK